MADLLGWFDENNVDFSSLCKEEQKNNKNENNVEVELRIGKINASNPFCAGSSEDQFQSVKKILTILNLPSKKWILHDEFYQDDILGLIRKRSTKPFNQKQETLKEKQDLKEKKEKKENIQEKEISATTTWSNKKRKMIQDFRVLQWDVDLRLSVQVEINFKEQNTNQNQNKIKSREQHREQHRTCFIFENEFEIALSEIINHDSRNGQNNSTINNNKTSYEIEIEYLKPISLISDSKNKKQFCYNIQKILSLFNSVFQSDNPTFIFISDCIFQSQNMETDSLFNSKDENENNKKEDKEESKKVIKSVKNKGTGTAKRWFLVPHTKSPTFF